MSGTRLPARSFTVTGRTTRFEFTRIFPCAAFCSAAGCWFDEVVCADTQPGHPSSAPTHRSAKIRLKYRQEFIRTSNSSYSWFPTMTLSLLKEWPFALRCSLPSSSPRSSALDYLDSRARPIESDLVFPLGYGNGYRHTPPPLSLFPRRHRAHSMGRRSSIQSLRENRSEERRVGKECRSRWSPYH